MCRIEYTTLRHITDQHFTGNNTTNKQPLFLIKQLFPVSTTFSGCGTGAGWQYLLPEPAIIGTVLLTAI